MKRILLCAVLLPIYLLNVIMLEGILPDLAQLLGIKSQAELILAGVLVIACLAAVVREFIARPAGEASRLGRQ